MVYLPLVSGEDLNHHYVSIQRSVACYDPIQKNISCVILLIKKHISLNPTSPLFKICPSFKNEQTDTWNSHSDLYLFISILIYSKSASRCRVGLNLQAMGWKLRGISLGWSSTVPVRKFQRIYTHYFTSTVSHSMIHLDCNITRNLVLRSSKELTKSFI